MAFIQLIEFHSVKFDEIQAIDKEWEQATEGKRTLRRSITCRDRNDPDRAVVIAFFDSYEAAMKNSQLPETGEFAKRIEQLVDEPPRFVDLDVVEDRT